VHPTVTGKAGVGVGDGVSVGVGGIGVKVAVGRGVRVGVGVGTGVPGAQPAPSQSMVPARIMIRSDVTPLCFDLRIVICIAILKSSLTKHFAGMCVIVKVASFQMT
jgi:hypothetical protein